MENILLVIHVLLAAGVIGLVLIQHGKGADMGAAFGSGASGTVFGAQGAGNFLSRTTAVLATLFFATSLTLAYLSGHRDKVESVTDHLSGQTPAVMVDDKASGPAADSMSDDPAPAVPSVPTVPGMESQSAAEMPAAPEPAMDDAMKNAIPAVPAGDQP